jgi:hypothetical protein
MLVKLERWALITEIVSGVAIVATLVLLIIEIRTNTAAVRSQNHSAVAQGIRELTMSIATDSEVARLLSPNLDWSAMTESEQEQLTGFYSSLLRIAEEAYLQYRSGALDEDVWQGRLNQTLRVIYARPNLRRIHEGMMELNRDAPGYTRDFLVLLDNAYQERYAESQPLAEYLEELDPATR